MDDKVIEFYNKQNKRKTIGDIFFDYYERKLTQLENREKLIKKIKRASK